jgi:hypothetical protein
LTPPDHHEKEMNLEELQSNGALELGVFGFVDNAHSTAT